MAFQTIWYNTDLPSEVVDIISNDLTNNFDSQMQHSKLHGDIINSEKRNSSNVWIPTNHWSAGFVWHYIQRANRENFLYDLTCIDGESIQYTRYNTGEFYGWHNDAGIDMLHTPEAIGPKQSTPERIGDWIAENTQVVRKLSFVLQLSSPDEYEGGNFQLMNEEGQSYFAPRHKGTIIIFDSRTQHRVLKVTSGTRKSLVGWVVGPRWR
jgi:predicted 2-oxoglutarate/Fe(II)-dependent dioxygenase YbiX